MDLISSSDGIFQLRTTKVSCNPFHGLAFTTSDGISLTPVLVPCKTSPLFTLKWIQPSTGNLATKFFNNNSLRRGRHPTQTSHRDLQDQTRLELGWQSQSFSTQRDLSPAKPLYHQPLLSHFHSHLDMHPFGQKKSTNKTRNWNKNKSPLLWTGKRSVIYANRS